MRGGVSRKRGGRNKAKREPAIKIRGGTVGSLDYKIIEAGRADDLFNWPKDNKYSYSGDEATLNHYIKEVALFTVMKIDTMQMKRNKDSTFEGEVTRRDSNSRAQARLSLKITQISVRERPKLFYVQARSKSICRAT